MTPAPEHTRLSEHTTLHVGGMVDEWVEARTTRDLVDSVLDADARDLDVLVLGGGSNVVAPDAGFRGRVVHVATRGLDSVDSGVLRIAAGEPWDDLVQHMVSQGWAGIEALSGIPGCTGATPIQNVGAYGQDVSQVLVSLTALDRRARTTCTLTAEDCSFGYRTSALKVDPARWVVLDVTFRLRASSSNEVTYPELARVLGVSVGERAAISDVREAVLELRRHKGMVLDQADHDTWSVGSFFTNPIVDAAVAARFDADCPRYPAAGGIKLSAAWLIEAAGMSRGFRLAPDARAAISSKHTLALVNLGGATAADILDLATQIQRRVHDVHGIALDIEPVVLQG
jgi:UDP-N-acetylmuramate dehydrogenase